MSANIYWSPISNKRRDIPEMAPSRFIGAITEVFGEFPLTLSTVHLAQLRAMSAVTREHRNGYQELAKAIEEHGSVQVEVEY